MASVCLLLCNRKNIHASQQKGQQQPNMQNKRNPMTMKNNSNTIAMKLWFYFNESLFFFIFLLVLRNSFIFCCCHFRFILCNSWSTLKHWNMFNVFMLILDIFFFFREFCGHVQITQRNLKCFRYSLDICKQFDFIQFLRLRFQLLQFLFCCP